MTEIKSKAHNTTITQIKCKTKYKIKANPKY